MARVDIVIPNYQYGKYLEQCVDSVLAQSLSDIRVLIIDNASSDGSVEIAKELMARDPRVELIRHIRNIGQVRSINEGIDWAASEYFLVLCSDDVLAGGALARAVAVMDQNRDIALCMGDYRHFTDEEVIDFIQSQSDGQPCQIYSGTQYVRRLCLSPLLSMGPFFVARTKAQKMAGYYRTSLLHTCDLEMMLRLCEFGLYAELRSIQGFRRLHGSNIANAYRDSKLTRLKAVDAGFESFFKNEGRLHRDAAQLRGEVRKRLASYGYWAGVAHLIAGQWQAARELFQFAFSQSPRCRIVPPVGALLSRKFFNRVRLALGETTAARSSNLAPSHGPGG